MELTDRVREYLDEKSRELSALFYEETLSYIKDGYECYTGKIESPIEQLFLVGWNFKHQINRINFNLEPQYQDDSTGEYILDFAVRLGEFAYRIFVCEDMLSMEEFEKIPEPKLGIELDGHIWHEKTKDQVQYHKKRERFLVSKEWKLLRFTGSEVFENPEKSVNETLDLANQLFRKYKESLEKLWSEKINGENQVSKT